MRGSPKGYINKKLFAEYGMKFILALAEEKGEDLYKGHLILMDSHYSHTFNYAFMRMMWRRNIKVNQLIAIGYYIIFFCNRFERLN